MEGVSPVWGNVLLRDLDVHPSRPQFLTSGVWVQPSLQAPTPGVQKPAGCTGYWEFCVLIATLLPDFSASYLP